MQYHDDMGNSIKNRLAFVGNGSQRNRLKRALKGINEHNYRFVRAVDHKTKARIDKLLEEFAWKETE